MIKVKWGVIGTGNIANTFVKDFEYVNNGEMIAVASRNKEKADSFREKHDLFRAYEGYENLVKDKEIDVVYIATPHRFHYRNIVMCLESGKSVLCEKPITVNSKQLQKVMKLAEEKKLFLMEAMWTRFLPVIKKTEQWIKDNKIGNIKILKADFGFNAEYNPESRLYNPEMAGGALLDVGVYTVAFVSYIINNEVTEISSDAYPGKTGVDEYNSIILKYKGGEIALLSSAIGVEMKDDAYIYGTGGYIYLPNFWKGERAVLNVKGKEEVYIDDRESEGYNFEAEEVNNMIIEKRLESKLYPPRQSFINLKIMDTIREQIDLQYPFE